MVANHSLIKPYFLGGWVAFVFLPAQKPMLSCVFGWLGDAFGHIFPRKLSIWIEIYLLMHQTSSCFIGSQLVNAGDKLGLPWKQDWTSQCGWENKMLWFPYWSLYVEEGNLNRFQKNQPIISFEARTFFFCFRIFCWNAYMYNKNAIFSSGFPGKHFPPNARNHPKRRPPEVILSLWGVLFVAFSQ